jgi:hypothetical protein
MYTVGQMCLPGCTAAVVPLDPDCSVSVSSRLLFMLSTLVHVPFTNPVPTVPCTPIPHAHTLDTSPAPAG